MSAAAPHPDQPQSRGQLETNVAGHEPLRGQASPHTLPRREQRPLRPHGRRLKNTSGKVGSLPFPFNPQERIRNRFREAARRRFALVRLLPRQEDPPKTTALAPPPLRHVSPPSPEEDGLRDAQERELISDSVMVAGQQVADHPTLLPIKLSSPDSNSQDYQVPQKQEFQSDVGATEDGVKVLLPTQVPPDGDEQHNEKETTPVESTNQHRGVPQGHSTGNGREQENASLQAIGFPTAGDGLPAFRERVRGQDVRPRLRFSGGLRENGGRIAIIHPVRYRRLRFRRPKFGVPKLVPKLVTRQGSEGGVQQVVIQPVGQPDPPTTLDLLGNNQAASVSSSSSSSAVGRGASHQQSMTPKTQKAPTYLPVHIKESEASLSFSEDPQTTEGERSVTTGEEALWEKAGELPKEEGQLGLVREVPTQLKVNVDPMEQPHHTDPDRQPGETDPPHLIQIKEPDTSSYLKDELSEDSVRSSAIASQTSPDPSSSTDGSARQPSRVSSRDEEEQLKELSANHQPPARQENFSKNRFVHRKSGTGQGSPPLRDFVRLRFDQDTKQGLQAYIPQQKPQSKQIQIIQSTQSAAPTLALEDKGVLQTSRDGRRLPHSAVTSGDAALQPEHQMRDEGGFILHDISSQHDNKRLPDMFAGGNVPSMDKEPTVAFSHEGPVSAAVLEEQSEPGSPMENSSLGSMKQLQDESDQTDHRVTTKGNNKGDKIESSSSQTKDSLGVTQVTTPISQQEQLEREFSHAADNQQQLQEKHTPHSLKQQHLPPTTSGTVTSTQDAPRIASREDTFSRVSEASGTLERGKEDKQAMRFKASLSGEGHTSKRRGPPPSRGDKDVITKEGLHSLDQTLPEGVSEQVSEPHRAIQHSSHQRLGAGNQRSSPQPETKSSSSNGQKHAEAYLSHLKTLESELERHVSRLRGAFNVKQLERPHQRSDASSILEEQIVGDRLRKVGVRGSQTSLLQSNEPTEAGKQRSHLRNNVSRPRGSAQSGDSGNESRTRDQLVTENKLRLRGELVGFRRQPGAGGSRRRYYSRGQFREEGIQEWPQRPLTNRFSGLRSWRKPTRTRTDGGNIHFRRGYTRSQSTPSTPTTLTNPASDSPEIQQQIRQQLPYPPRTPPSYQGGVRFFHPSRDEKTTFPNLAAAPKISSGIFASFPQPSDQLRRSGSPERARQRLASLQTSQPTLRAPVISRQDQQHHLLMTSRRLTNSHGPPALTFDRFSEGDSSKEISAIQNANYYASSANVSRPRGSPAAPSTRRREEPSFVPGHPRIATSKNPSARLSSATGDGVHASALQGTFRQPLQGTKSSFLGRVEGSFRPVTQRGSRKFVDTLQGMDKGMEKKALLRSLAAFLRGQDLSGHWITQDVPRVNFQGPPSQPDIPQTGTSS